MRVIPNPTMAFFPNLMYFSTYFPIFIIYYPKCEGKGSFPKSHINSLDVIVGPDLGLNCLQETSSLISIQNCFGGGSVVVDFLFIITPIVGVCNCSMFCCTLLYVNSSIAIILMGKRELVALLNLSSWCLVMVERLFLAVPRGFLRFVIVAFPDHTYYFWLTLADRVSIFLVETSR